MSMNEITRPFRDLGSQSRRLTASGSPSWYYAPSYHAPKAVAFLSRMPRFGHSNSFAKIASLSADERRDYLAGVFGFCGMLLAMFLLWGATLLCAKFRLLERCKMGGRRRNKKKKEADSENYESALGNGGVTTETESVGDGEVLLDEWPTQISRTVVTQKQRKPFLTRHRAGLLVLISACCVLVSSVFLLLLGVSSLKEATSLMSESNLDAQEVIGEGKAIASSLLSAHSHFNQFRSNTTLDLGSMCPLSNSTLSMVLGIDVAAAFGVMNDQIQNLDYFMRQNVTQIYDSLLAAEAVLNEVNGIVVEVDRRRWVLPTFFLILGMTVSGVVALLLLGRCKGYSSDFTRKSWGRILLPLLILVMIACCVATLAMGFVALLSSDGCTAGSPTGNPGITAINVLNERNVDPQGQLYNLVESYTGGCKAQDPTYGLVKLENDLRISIISLQRFLSDVNRVGVTQLGEACGDHIEGTLSKAREFARTLDAVLEEVDRAKEAMMCKHIYPIYVEAVHDSICTQVANWASVSFPTLLFTSTAMLVIVSLERFILSGKKKSVSAPKETEPVEANEHEEYLEYISKYKSEWNEYHGFDAASVLSEEDLNASIHSNPDLFDDSYAVDPQSPELNTINELDEIADEEVSTESSDRQDDRSEGSRDVWFAPPSTGRSATRPLNLTVVSQDDVESGHESGVIFDGIDDVVSQTSAYEEENVGFSSQSCRLNTLKQTPKQSSPRHFVFESASSGESSPSSQKGEVIEIEWTGNVDAVALNIDTPDLEEVRDTQASNRMEGNSEVREAMALSEYKPSARKTAEQEKVASRSVPCPINSEAPLVVDQGDLGGETRNIERSPGMFSRGLAQNNGNLQSRAHQEKKDDTTELDNEVDSTMRMIHFRRTIEAFEDAGAGSMERLRGEAQWSESEQFASPKIKPRHQLQGSTKMVKHLISKFDQHQAIESSNNLPMETWPFNE